jgi:hypothetical protein
MGHFESGVFNQMSQPLPLPTMQSTTHQNYRRHRARNDTGEQEVDELVRGYIFKHRLECFVEAEL